MAGGVAATVGGLYFVVTQDLGHGPGHDEDHHAEGHETHGENEEGEKDDTFQDENNTSGDKHKSMGGPKDETKSKTKNAPKEDQDNSQADDPSQPGTGKPDKKKSADASTDDYKNDENDKASPDKSDKVCRIVVVGQEDSTDFHSPTRAASPSPPTRPRASRKASPTATPTTARRSPSRTTRAKRARASLRLRSSKAPCLPTDLALRTRRSAERLSRIRRHSLGPLIVLSNYPVCHSIRLYSGRNILYPSFLMRHLLSWLPNFSPDLR
jgi:hypothetical protein